MSSTVAQSDGKSPVELNSTHVMYIQRFIDQEARPAACIILMHLLYTGSIIDIFKPLVLVYHVHINLPPIDANFYS